MDQLESGTDQQPRPYGQVESNGGNFGVVYHQWHWLPGQQLVSDFIFWRLLGGIRRCQRDPAPAYVQMFSLAFASEGRLGSLQQLAIVWLGFFHRLLSDYFIAGQSAGSAELPVFGRGGGRRRWMFRTIVIPANSMDGSFNDSRIPAVAQGREQEASSVLAKLLGGGNVLAKLEEIKQTVVRKRWPVF